MTDDKNSDKNSNKAAAEDKDIQVEEIVEEETDLIAGGAFDACSDAVYFGGSGPTLI
jgi:hypothetical protein